ncbi:MAG: CDP-glycerol glycerophosphotransferase family protein [Terrisporobacter sp.]|uniref:bifunctional glycosyltransferase/CDP-glycerol:glycerophosphate glycerophosphotransferase n=1 Tax=Clostridia TaxID=186801 RepID=UPI002FC70543
MLDNQYKVSVIIPVYNVEAYLRETLDSIMNQTLKDVEIILVNDGSTDGSQNIIDEYAKKYENIVSIYQDNAGPGQARNKGIKAATGKYTVFVDSDDILPHDSLEVRYNLAEENNADMIVCATCMYNGEETWPVKTHFFEEGEKDIRKNYELFWMMGPCNKLYSTELIKDLEFPAGINYGEDQVFVTRAYIRAKKIFSTQYVAYHYRIRNNPGESLTQQVFVNPHKVIDDVKKSWVLALNEINSHISNRYIARELEEAYLIRLVDINIWPPFKNAIVSKNNEVQIEALKSMSELLDNIDSKILNQFEKLRWMLTRGVIERFLFLTKDARKEYIKLLSKTFKKLDVDNVTELREHYAYMVDYMEKSVKHNSTKYIYMYLIRRRLRRVRNTLNRRSNKAFFYLCKLLPIKKNKVVLASNKSQYLTGNLRAVYDELIERDNSEIKVYLDKYRNKLEILKMYYNFATAKTILLDDYYRQLYGLKFRSDTEVIQVWHACGAFKKFGFSAIGKRDGNSLRFEQNAHLHYTKVVTSSKDINKHYADAFHIKEENALPLGVPRTDILLDKDYREYITNRLLDDYPSLEGKKIITYAPTFRGGAKERQNFKLKLDPVKILQSLGDDYAVVLKLHPSVKNGLNGSLDIPHELSDRILSLDSSIDVNELLVITDILITDYSSVLFEAALLDKKILLYAYDKEAYLGERDFYYDYDEFVPGPIAYNNKDIIDIVKEDKFDINKVRSFKNRFFDYNDGKASKRLVDYITSKR